MSLFHFCHYFFCCYCWDYTPMRRCFVWLHTRATPQSVSLSPRFESRRAGVKLSQASSSILPDTRRDHCQQVWSYPGRVVSDSACANCCCWWRCCFSTVKWAWLGLDIYILEVNFYDRPTCAQCLWCPMSGRKTSGTSNLFILLHNTTMLLSTPCDELRHGHHSFQSHSVPFTFTALSGVVVVSSRYS